MTLSHRQLQVLRLIAESRVPPSHGDIAAILGFNRARAKQHILRLEELGMVERVGNGRRVAVFATAKARELFAA